MTKKLLSSLLVTAFCLMFGDLLMAEEAAPLLDWEVLTYRKAGDLPLTLHIMRPSGSAAGEHAAAVFFVCGGWAGVDPDKHKQYCAYLASRGMTAITAVIRTRKIHDVPIEEMVKDAKAAVRYVRSHHAKLGADPARIAVSGASAAGHISACTALVEGLEHEGEDLSVSSRPNAVAIFCPVLVPEQSEERVELFGGRDRANALSPLRSIRKDAPPFLIMHSVLDQKVDVDGIRAFAFLMKSFGNRCDLELYDYRGSGHGFQGWWGGKNPGFYGCLKNIDDFFVSLGYLEGNESVDGFDFIPYVAEKK